MITSGVTFCVNEQSIEARSSAELPALTMTGRRVDQGMFKESWRITREDLGDGDGSRFVVFPSKITPLALTARLRILFLRELSARKR